MPAAPSHPVAPFTERLNGPKRPVDLKDASTSYAEKHYRVGDLARMWGLGRETVREFAKDGPGVINVRMGAKKSHTVYSVPESAAGEFTRSCFR
jgi:hypothetical protein